MGKLYYANYNHKKSRVAILISDYTGFNTKKLLEIKRYIL